MCAEVYQRMHRGFSVLLSDQLKVAQRGSGWEDLYDLAVRTKNLAKGSDNFC